MSNSRRILTKFQFVFRYEFATFLFSVIQNELGDSILARINLENRRLGGRKS